ncbi:MAG: sporulation protein YqfD [Hyphomonadaceae bacterium]|nr:sporulation protein YqfD [Clostridia bacterium]
MFIVITRWFRGFITLYIEGYFCEKFINLCAVHRISIWHVRKINHSAMSLRMETEAFKKMREIAHKTRCKVKIKSKHGLPFILFRYRKRKPFLFGVAFAICMMLFMGAFVWEIEIVGNDKIPTENLMAELSQCGLVTGQFKNTFDCKQIAEDMMVRMNELSWVSVDIKGTKAYVYLKERVMPPKIVSKDTPCNIIATRDGVIKSIVTKNGGQIVKVGDTVQKGQLLVSGILENIPDGTEKSIGTRYVHAISEVHARTWYEKATDVKLKQSKKILTGNQMSKTSVNIFNFSINLFINTGISYANYDKITKNSQWSIGKHFSLPVKVTSDIYQEVLLEEEIVTPEQAITQATDTLVEEIKKELPPACQVVKPTQDHVTVDADTITVRVVLECLENIATQEEIMKE